MKGIHELQLKNRDASFRFSLKRNITIVRGDSATGKTTLYNMAEAYMRDGVRSGVQVKCDKPIVALGEQEWETRLEHTKDSIVFIEENVGFTRQEAFASAVKRSDNYYVIISREDLNELPYGVDEIYEIKMSGRHHTFVPMYRSDRAHVYAGGKEPFAVLLTEDSHSGLEFYQKYFEGTDIHCETALSNSGILPWLKKHQDARVLIVADGAAFGAVMNRIMAFQRQFPNNVTVCLPESFEWLILKSGLIDRMNSKIPAILENPSDHIESGKYFNWEQFFEKLLISSTMNSDMDAAYTRSRLKAFYLLPHNRERIAGEIADVLKKHAL